MVRCFHSEQKIQDAIHSLKGQFIIIVIAHRLSTIKDSSNIIFLENGCIKESGTHQSLMANESYYYNLVQQQSFNDSEMV